jgi:hypothetical protein
MVRSKAMEQKEKREKRNTLIMQFFFAGWSEREIARHHSIGLTPGRVHQIISEEMKNLAGRHDLLSDQALPMYIERLETLLKATWPKAVSGDLKAIEVARRLLEQGARLWNLEEEGKLPAIPPMTDQELDDDDTLDQLSKYRARRQRRSSGS